MKLLFFVISMFYFTAGQNLPRLDGKIVGGQQVSITEFPHQVSIRIYDQHVCGGTIIGPETILTACHCVHGMQHSGFSIRVGHSYHSMGQSYRVSRIIEHPNYNPQSFDNDMAILKLAVPLTYSTRVQAIALQPDGAEVPIGTTAWVSGWGVLYEGSQQVSDRLRAVDVVVLTNYYCSRRYASGEISSRMLCAQTYNHDSCQGDSGGPLVADNRLIGVVSWGYGCARPQYPGIYAKVSNMYKWIVSQNP